MIVFFNGKFVDENEVSISMNDGGFLMGHGVYEALRTFGGKLRFVDEHIDRLFASAESMGLPLPYSKNELADITQELVAKRYEEIGSNDKELRIRYQITSGLDSVRYGGIKNCTFIITAFELDKFTMKSVKVVTLDIERVSPKVKTTAMITNILCKKFAYENGAYESLMINHNGLVTEGTFSNIFLIKDGVLKTPKDDILKGITRSEILKLAKDFMSIEECEISKDELYLADEIFLSSSTVGLLPVTHVDERMVGDGEIGESTLELKKAYNDFVSK
ncbi:MAG: aminotransferase class IV [Candidatus Peregrinibacteria bacterium]|nr:aminotransferase class IV [Candidatus Peregrinibacteria bacterium]MDZ4245270.1 aminotransferase class IV [Candidatus Gracilibacteria bacterium]